MSEATSPYSWPLSICFAGDMIEAAVHGGPGVPPNQLAQGSESWSDLPWVPRPAAGMAGAPHSGPQSTFTVLPPSPLANVGGFVRCPVEVPGT